MTANCWLLLVLLRYVLSPVDLIPDWSVIGLVDDVLVRRSHCCSGPLAGVLAGPLVVNVGTATLPSTTHFRPTC